MTFFKNLVSTLLASLVVFIVIIFYASCSFAQTSQEIKSNPLVYSQVLWFDAIQNDKGFDQTVETVLREVIERLREKPEFKSFFPENYDVYRDRRVLISKTPNPHLIVSGREEIQHFCLPFYLFLENDPVETIALHLITLYRNHQTGESQHDSGRWARAYLGLPPQTPSWVAQADILQRLRGRRVIRLEDFINLKQAESITLQFRVLEDPEGLMVPISQESKLLDLVEGDPRATPIVEVPLDRILSRIELQLIKHLISDIQESEINRAVAVDVGEFTVSLLVWFGFERVFSHRLKLKYGKPKMIRSMIYATAVMLIVDPYVIEPAVEASDIKERVNEGNVESRKKFQDAYKILSKGFEKAKMRSFDLVQFKRDFFYSLGLTYETAETIYLTESESDVLNVVETDFVEMIQRKRAHVKRDLKKVQATLERLRGAVSFVDRSAQGMGLTYCRVPPRKAIPEEEIADVAVVGTAVTIVGEFIYTKFMGLKRILYSGRLLGPVALGTVAIDYLFGVSKAEEIILPQDQKEIIQEELGELEDYLEAVIKTCDLECAAPYDISGED